MREELDGNLLYARHSWIFLFRKVFKQITFPLSVPLPRSQTIMFRKKEMVYVGEVELRVFYELVLIFFTNFEKKMNFTDNYLPVAPFTHVEIYKNKH